jgi:hypothetical protein
MTLSARPHGLASTTQMNGSRSIAERSRGRSVKALRLSFPTVDRLVGREFSKVSASALTPSLPQRKTAVSGWNANQANQ